MKKLATLFLFGILLYAFPLMAETVLFAPDADKTGGENGVWSVSQNEPGRRNAALIPVPVELIAGKNILLAAEIEQQDISEKPNHWNGVKLLLEMTFADGKKHYPQALNSSGTLSWTPHAVAFSIPNDIRDAKILLALENVSGSARFRKVRIIENIPVDYDGYRMTGLIHKENAEYQSGEEMFFTFRLFCNDIPATGQVRVVCAGDDGKTEIFYEQFNRTGVVTLRRVLDQAGFVMAKATLLTAHGVPAKSKGREIQYGLGAGVAAETLRQGIPEPEDFNAYWKTQKERLDAVPIEVLEKKLHKESGCCFIYDMKIKGIGERPVSGYLSVPKNAKDRSLPLRLSYGGYSFLGANEEESPDRITFNVNPHGIENGRERSYYDALQRGELANYGFRDEENQQPETCYFNNMVLRDLRALQFGRTLPEWDGQTIEIHGGSQGAFRTMAVAALSEGITRCDIRVPWLCDLGGITLGRVRGWRPNPAPGLGYFDTVNFAKRVQCPVEIAAGLTDWVCPPSGVFVLYNNLKAPAKLTLFQGLDHGGYPAYDQQSTPKTVYNK